MTECACGCGGELVGRQQKRYLHNHHRSKSPVQYLVDDNGCWVWQRSISDDGYPTMGIGNRRTDKAHRVFYREHRGEIPEGHELHHICHVRRCVNPAHLEPVLRLDHRRKHPRPLKCECGECKGCRARNRYREKHWVS